MPTYPRPVPQPTRRKRIRPLLALCVLGACVALAACGSSGSGSSSASKTSSTSANKAGGPGFEPVHGAPVVPAETGHHAARAAVRRDPSSRADPELEHQVVGRAASSCPKASLKPSSKPR